MPTPQPKNPPHPYERRKQKRNPKRGLRVEI